MKRIFSLFIFFLFIFLFSRSQPAIQWQKSLGGTSNEQAFYIRQTTDGGYITAGIADSDDGDVNGHHLLWDCWLVKLDSAGAIQWQKPLGGSGEDEAFCIQQTTDGGYIVAALSESSDGDLTLNYGGWDYWMIKLTGSGNIQWQKSLGGSSVDGAQSVQQTADGGYVVAGFSQSTDVDVTGNHGSNDYWILKLDTGGTIQWKKSLGGSGSDGAYAIQIAADGGYLVAGGASSGDGDVTGNHGNSDFWLVKLDTGGTLQWQKSLGGTGTDFAYSVFETADAGYIIGGRSTSNDGDVTANHGTNDYWVVKLDSSRTIEWEKSLGGTNTDGLYSLEPTTDGGYIIAGGSYSNDGDVSGNHGMGDYWLVKIDSAGTLLWQKCFGGTRNDFANSIQQTQDGGYVIAGSSYSNDNDVTANHDTTGIASDYWIVKLAPDTATGIGENSVQDNEINIFPNPAAIEFRIKNAELRIEAVEVYDLYGRKTYTERLTSRIDVSTWTEGIYFVRVKSGHGIKTLKLIVQH